MMQVLGKAVSLQVTTASTSATQFADNPARLVVIQADSSNAGTIQILGVTGSTPDSAGPALTAGSYFPTLWTDNLSKLGYKASNSGDKINVLILR